MPVISATGSHGFTLLELLVVLAILVLLAGAWPLAAPRLFPTQQLRNEAEHLVNVLRVTRMTARLTGEPQRLEITDQGASYRSGRETHALPHGATAQLQETGDSVAGNAMTFFPDGSSTGGVFSLVLPNRSESIRVGALTGRAEIEE
jgi:general secretion pathway protein H